jgi:hypothetical protein
LGAGLQRKTLEISNIRAVNGRSIGSSSNSLVKEALDSRNQENNIPEIAEEVCCLEVGYIGRRAWLLLS